MLQEVVAGPVAIVVAGLVAGSGVGCGYLIVTSILRRHGDTNLKVSLKIYFIDHFIYNIVTKNKCFRLTTHYF